MPLINPASGVQAGTVMHFAASTAPAGWLKANGAAVSRTLYAALFAAIGITYGAGDGSTTFNLPNLRGEFLRGLDDGRGVDAGRAIGSAQTDEIRSHSHTVLISNNGEGGGAQFAFPNPTSATTSQVGSTGGAETRPRNVALLACIKY